MRRNRPFPFIIVMMVSLLISSPVHALGEGQKAAPGSSAYYDKKFSQAWMQTVNARVKAARAITPKKLLTRLKFKEDKKFLSELMAKTKIRQFPRARQFAGIWVIDAAPGLKVHFSYADIAAGIIRINDRPFSIKKDESLASVGHRLQIFASHLLNKKKVSLIDLLLPAAHAHNNPELEDVLVMNTVGYITFVYDSVSVQQHGSDYAKAIYKTLDDQLDKALKNECHPMIGKGRRKVVSNYSQLVNNVNGVLNSLKRDDIHHQDYDEYKIISSLIRKYWGDLDILPHGTHMRSNEAYDDLLKKSGKDINFIKSRADQWTRCEKVLYAMMPFPKKSEQSQFEGYRKKVCAKVTELEACFIELEKLHNSPQVIDYKRNYDYKSVEDNAIEHFKEHALTQ